jgi:hypothetical protein
VLYCTIDVTDHKIVARDDIDYSGPLAQQPQVAETSTRSTATKVADSRPGPSGQAQYVVIQSRLLFTDNS